MQIEMTDSKGLVQKAVGNSQVMTIGQITRTIRTLENTVTTSAHAGTTTDTGITPPAGCRILGYKLEILSVTGVPAGAITDLGFKAGDVDAISGTTDLALAMNAVGTLVRPAADPVRNVNVPATEIMITHEAAGAADRSCEVRVSIVIEEFS